MKEWFTKTLFDWAFVLLYRLLQGFLYLLSFVEKFFDVFAGTAKVYYKGDTRFLIDIFFGHSAVTNAFWAMALIAIALAFGFAILNLARKVTDVSGRMKQSVGDIMGNFIRCFLIVILINAGTVAAINMTNVLLDRVNYALNNASVLNQDSGEKTFSNQEFATMARILATVGNYSVNPTSDSRYNINSCYNALRPDLLSLYVNGFFDYDYRYDKNGHYTWQGALQLIAASADLTQDLPLDVYNSEVSHAIQTVARELTTYKDFAPQETARREVAGSMDTDMIIFLLCGMDAAENAQFRTGRFDDALRKDYINGVKSYNDLTQVRKDFDIWRMDYLLGYFSTLVMIILLSICIFTFIVRMFNLMLLYITAPLFASSMPLDEGGKWQSWMQAFIIQLFSGFGLVIAMRLYLIVIPIILSNDLVFFAGDNFGVLIMNHMAQLMMILGGTWAVVQSGNVITGILAGNPGMAAIQQEGQIGGTVMRYAFGAPRAAIGAAKVVGATTLGVAKAVGGSVLRSAGRQIGLGAKSGLNKLRESFGGKSSAKLPGRSGRSQNPTDAQLKKSGAIAGGRQRSGAAGIGGMSAGGKSTSGPGQPKSSGSTMPASGGRSVPGQSGSGKTSSAPSAGGYSGGPSSTGPSSDGLSENITPPPPRTSLRSDSISDFSSPLSDSSSVSSLSDDRSAAYSPTGGFHTPPSYPPPAPPTQRSPSRLDSVSDSSESHLGAPDSSRQGGFHTPPSYPPPAPPTQRASTGGTHTPPSYPPPAPPTQRASAGGTHTPPSYPPPAPPTQRASAGGRHTPPSYPPPAPPTQRASVGGRHTPPSYPPPAPPTQSSTSTVQNVTRSTVSTQRVETRTTSSAPHTPPSYAPPAPPTRPTASVPPASSRPAPPGKPLPPTPPSKKSGRKSDDS